MTTPTPYESFKSAALGKHASLTPPSGLPDPAKVVEEIRRDLEKNIVACAPKNCGIVKITAKAIGWDKEAEEDFEEQIKLPGDLFLLQGIDNAGHHPLQVRLLIIGPDVHVTFILAAGRDASMDDYGKKRGSRFNVVVLALFGLSAIKLFARAYHSIRNSPIDADVRKLYTKMGFANGEVLDIRDKGRITILLSFIVRTLSAFKLDPTLLRY